jgi:hypothetical protein
VWLLVCDVLMWMDGGGVVVEAVVWVGGECVWWMREGEEGGWKVAYLAVAGEAERRG